MSISGHMNKYPFHASIFKKLLVLTICIGACLLMTGCMVYHAGGAKQYNVKASTKEGIWFANAFNVKLVCEDVYGLFWTDFYMSKDCIYAYDVKVDSSNELGFTEKTIHFRPIKEEFVEKLGLEPDFSWWEKYGFLIVAGAVYLFFQSVLTAISGEERDWRHVARDILVVVFLILPVVIAIRICGTWL